MNSEKIVQELIDLCKSNSLIADLLADEASSNSIRDQLLKSFEDPDAKKIITLSKKRKRTSQRLN